MNGGAYTKQNLLCHQVTKHKKNWIKEETKQKMNLLMKMELRTRTTAAIEQTEIDTNENEKYV